MMGIRAAQHECDECGLFVSNFSRIEKGRHYCSTCYARCFKQGPCPGCGISSRLLASDPGAQCRKCAAARPCIRCHRSGRALGLMLPQGPVCNACYVYFREPQCCSVCNQLVRRYSRSGPDLTVVCLKCAGSNNKTCGVCRYPRACTARSDGTWICHKCQSEPYTTCQVCQASVEPGRNGRCVACYWQQRCKHKGEQLTEMFHLEPVRQAFASYMGWALAHTDAERLCSALTRHVEFFTTLDQHPNAVWDEDFVLRVFGTGKLRKYELPMRWLQDRYALALAPEAKRANAEVQTSRKLVQSLPAGSVASAVLQAFFYELHVRVDVGKIKPRSMRMALRPAVSLLLAVSPEGAAMPNQAALNDMLRSAPGQRAAVSTFLGFLKVRYSVKLVAHKSEVHRQAHAREKLGAKLAEIARSSRRDAKARYLWDVTALRYFHHLRKIQAQELVKTANRITSLGGNELQAGSQVFWLPHPPWN